MSYSIVLTHQKYIDTYLNILAVQKSLNGSIRVGKALWTGVADFMYDEGISPTFIFNFKGLSLKTDTTPIFSFFSGNIQLVFKAKVTRLAQNRVTFKKPNRITVIRRRQSERYIPREPDAIYLNLPSTDRKAIVADIGSEGIALISETPLFETGSSIPNCILHSTTHDFTVTCFFQYGINLTEKKWKYGVKIEFPDESSYMVYFEWLYHLFHPDFFTPTQISLKNLKVCYENTRSVIITNDAFRTEIFNTELRLWGVQNQIRLSQCNIAYIKSNKLISACTTKRIYDNTFVAQRMICIPGIHLNASPKLSIYSALSEFLFHHPSCNYLIQYKDRDIEWHEDLFNRLVIYSRDPYNVHFDKLFYLDISVDRDRHSDRINTFTFTLLKEHGELVKYLKRHESALVIDAYNYCNIPLDIGTESDLLPIPMQRNAYKILSRHSLIGYAVCEVFDKKEQTDNSLDMCRLHLCSNVNNLSVLLNEIADNVSPFFAKHSKNRFRIVWKKQNDRKRNYNVRGGIFQGTLLRLILSKNGLSLLQQAVQISREMAVKYYHLSYPQQSIWQYEHLYPATTINTIFCTITMNDDVEFTLLEKAINAVIRKNDATRIQVTRRHGKPCQYALSAGRTRISFIDFTTNGINDTFSSFSKILERDPIPLYDSRLFNFIMFRNKNGECGYFIKAHHIVADAWTIGNIANSIADLYLLLKTNIGIRHYKAPSYIDFISKNFEYSLSNSIEQHKNFWIDNTKDSPLLNIGNPQMAIKTEGASKRKSFVIKGTIAKNILKYMQTTSCTPFSFFISCLYIYLYKTTGNTTITIGTSVLNRSGPQDKATAGLFVGARPLKTTIDFNSAFIELTRQVAINMRKLLKNHKFPYELLLKNLRAEGFHRYSLYDITFTYQNYRLRPDFSLIWHPYSYQTEALNIHVNDWEGKGAFNIDYDYHTVKFTEKDIIRMHRHILVIIESVIKHPERAISTISLLVPKETALILNTFNNTSCQYPDEKNLHQLFEEQAARNPNQIALIENNVSLTYDQLNRKANRLARLLLSLNHDLVNNCIGVLIENSSHQVVAQLGILKSGNAYIPLDTRTPRLRIKSIIDDANIKSLLTLSEHNYAASRLLWECSTLSNIVFLDTHETYIPEDWSNQPLMNFELWEHTGKNACDEITAGGWVNSYTGEPFSTCEMEEFGNNALLKLKQYLSSSKRILEIGCASGITMFRIASLVKYYHGTDLSETIISRNMEYINQNKITNISLSVLPAHHISTIRENNFDIVIINSVIQAFPGYNYLRKVIRDAIALLNQTGLIFIGDIMDLDRKHDLIDSLKEYKKDHPDKSLKTKTDFSNELFVPRHFFDNQKNEMREIHAIEYSDKIHSIKNELTDYRYDALLHIDKTIENTVVFPSTQKTMYGTSDFNFNDDSNPNIPLPSSSLAYIIYTSGTSGKPKGVMIEHKSVVNLCWWYIKYYKLAATDIIARSISFSFDPSVAELFPGLLSGAAIVIIPNEIVNDPYLLNIYFNNAKVSVCILPTPLFELFQYQPNSSLRLVIVGGDKLSKYITNSYSVFNNYGPTENTVITTVFPVDRQYANIPIGRPIANTFVYILDENDNLLPIGISGELCISGDGLARGYINDADPDKFVENPFVAGTRMYKTGDKARWLPDGNIEFIGRMDDQVKLRGFRIELKEIEAVLSQNHPIDRAAVIIKESVKGDKFLCAYYESPQKTSDDKLVHFLSERLPYYMIPHLFVHLQKMPVLPSGKIDRRTLMTLNVSCNDATEEDCILCTETERSVAEIWKNVLYSENIKASDNFFKIGGDSLNAVEVCTAFSEKNIPVSVQDLYDFPTVSSLAAHIDGQTINSKDTCSPDISYRKCRESVDTIDIGRPERIFKNILLTGSTGFLGMHLLRQIIAETDAHIFCLIRGDDKEDIKSRFEDNYSFYFKNENMDTVLERISFLKGDMSRSDLSLESGEYTNIMNTVDTIFHCAALVKANGTYEELKKTNYDGLISIASLAKTAKARLYHISSMGISGGKDIRQDEPNALFTENDLYIGQHYLDNPYVRSKFEAENYLLNEINNGMNATIFRIGLITERWEDGIFQKNITDNYFHATLKALFTVGDIPGNVLEYEFDMSPVDLCSKAIFKLAEVEGCSGKIFHIYNPHKITFRHLFELFRQSNIGTNILPKMLHKKYIQHLQKNRGEFKNEINKLAVDFNFDKMLSDQYTCRWNADITQKYLSLLGFKWPRINNTYIKKIASYLREIDFLQH